MSPEPVVILTRPRGENAGLAVRVAADGIASRELPCVETRALEDPAALRDAVRTVTIDDLLVITSRAGVRAVAAALDGAPCVAPVAAVGPATASACRQAGLRVVFVPSLARGAALAAHVPLPRGAILLARSDRAAREPAEILACRGATVREIVAYRTIPVAPGTVPDGAVVVFASPSAVDGFALSGATDVAAAIAVGDATATRAWTVLGIRARVTGPDEVEIAAVVRALVRDQDAVTGR